MPTQGGFWVLWTFLWLGDRWPMALVRRGRKKGAKLPGRAQVMSLGEPMVSAPEVTLGWTPCRYRLGWVSPASVLL